MLAVDLPFVSRGAVRVFDRAGARVGCDGDGGAGGWGMAAVVRRVPAGVCRRGGEGSAAGRYKIDTLFEAAAHAGDWGRRIESRWFFADMFRNLNTPEELAAATET